MKGEIAGKEPIKVEVTCDQNYFWCSCGKSSNQPFCDGSHKETEFVPLKWTADADGDKFFCTCKQTNNAPFCDGSHKNC